MEWYIGNVKIKNQVVLAPMAGISNTSYRKIIKGMGAGLICAEMVSDKAITFGSKKTIDLLKMDDSERPISQQIFGSDISSFVEAAKYIEATMKPDILDINMGCPVPKVAIRAQAGSSLLKDPKKVYEIVKNVVEAVSIPVTVKIRSGWDSTSINAVEVAKQIEKAGASAITVHPRTRAQGYSGVADWNIIKDVKESVSIPVIGNGDIRSCYDAKRMLEETGCDAVMIGRACIGNPWIFRDCVEYLEHAKAPTIVEPEERVQMLKHHYDILINDIGEKGANLEIRTHALSYLKSLPGNAEIKNAICQTKTKEEMFNILDNYLEQLKNHD